MVNEPSGFELLRLYCNLLIMAAAYQMVLDAEESASQPKFKNRYSVQRQVSGMHLMKLLRTEIHFDEP